jgi:hypothetical protein
MTRTGVKAALLWSAAAVLMVFGGPAPAAHADPICPPGKGCMKWCPGDPNPAGRPVPWDTGVCHDFFWDNRGVYDIGTRIFYPWNAMPW